MRQFIFVVVVFVGLFILSALVGDAQTKQTYFSSGPQCIDALNAGTANFYRPTYFNLHKATASNEEARGLESDACAHMLTVKGKQWVAQKEGEKMVFRGLVIVRREDCGNPIDEILYPKSKPVTVAEFKCPEGTYPSETPGVCIQEKEKIVTNTVTVQVPVEKPVYINPCPGDSSFTGTTSWKSRLGGGLLQATISGGASLAITKARGATWGNAGYSALYGVGMQRIEQGLNASQDGFRLRIPSLGIDQKIHKGRDIELSQGISVKWEGDHAYLIRTMNGQSFRCDGDGLKKASNLGVWTDGGESNQVGGITPTKTLPTSGSQFPIRPGTGTGRNPGTVLPVGNNGPVGSTTVNTTNSVPTRPRLGNSLVDSYMQPVQSLPSQQVFSNTSAPTTPAPQGQIWVMLNGQWQLMKSM